MMFMRMYLVVHTIMIMTMAMTVIMPLVVMPDIPLHRRLVMVMVIVIVMVMPPSKNLARDQPKPQQHHEPIAEHAHPMGSITQRDTGEAQRTRQNQHLRG